MAYPILPSNRGPIKVSRELKEALLEFTMSCLLEQPEELLPYAQEYFEKLLEEHTLLELDDSIDSHFLGEEVQPLEVEILEDFEYTRGRGRVVYSEPYNPEDDSDDDEEDVIFEKTEKQREILMNVVKNCLLFRSLDNDHINRVIDVMFPKKAEPGEIMIKQYDDGDNFYIIEYGLFDVLIAEDPDSEPVHVFTYPGAGNFGELALMYNMPRAATIRAATEGMLWAMDRQTFRKIVLKAAFKKRKMYEALISKVHILQKLTPYERMNVADALIPKVFYDGAVIIKQKDTADGLYFIEKGEVACFVTDPESQDQFEVSRISEGGYFGELALLTHKPRAATVIAKGDVKAAFLDVEAFERLLGPCLDIMERNISSYDLQMKTILEGRSTRLRG